MSLNSTSELKPTSAYSTSKVKFLLDNGDVVNPDTTIDTSQQVAVVLSPNEDTTPKDPFLSAFTTASRFTSLLPIKPTVSSRLFNPTASSLAKQEPGRPSSATRQPQPPPPVSAAPPDPLSFALASTAGLRGRVSVKPQSGGEKESTNKDTFVISVPHEPSTDTTVTPTASAPSSRPTSRTRTASRSTSRPRFSVTNPQANTLLSHTTQATLTHNDNFGTLAEDREGAARRPRRPSAGHGSTIAQIAADKAAYKAANKGIALAIAAPGPNNAILSSHGGGGNGPTAEGVAPAWLAHTSPATASMLTTTVASRSAGATNATDTVYAQEQQLQWFQRQYRGFRSWSNELLQPAVAIETTETTVSDAGGAWRGKKAGPSRLSLHTLPQTSDGTSTLEYAVKKGALARAFAIIDTLVLGKKTNPEKPTSEKSRSSHTIPPGSLSTNDGYSVLFDPRCFVLFTSILTQYSAPWLALIAPFLTVSYHASWEFLNVPFRDLKSAAKYSATGTGKSGTARSGNGVRGGATAGGASAGSTHENGNPSSGIPQRISDLLEKIPECIQVLLPVITGDYHIWWCLSYLFQCPPHIGTLTQPSAGNHPQNKGFLSRFLRVVSLLDFARAEKLLAHAPPLFTGRVLAGTALDVGLLPLDMGTQGQNKWFSIKITINNDTKSTSSRETRSSSQNRNSEASFPVSSTAPARLICLPTITSSQQLLQALATTLLPSSLSLTLTRAGLRLRVIQSEVDSFDFSVHRLSTDMRDGVRLCKLAEVLCVRAVRARQQRKQALMGVQVEGAMLPWDGTGVGTGMRIGVDIGVEASNDVNSSFQQRLAQVQEEYAKLLHQLYVPCTTREQALHNVSIALSALAKPVPGIDARTGPFSETEFSGILGDIESSLHSHVTAAEEIEGWQRFWRCCSSVDFNTKSTAPESIVDGQHEHLLGLIWRMSYRWQLPLLITPNALAREIQAVRASQKRIFFDDAYRYMMSTELSSLLRWTQTVTWAASVRFPYIRSWLMPQTGDGNGNVNGGNIGMLEPRQASSSSSKSSASLASSRTKYWEKFESFPVVNFSRSLANGVVLCLLVHHYYPHLLPLHHIVFPHDYAKKQRILQGDIPSITATSTEAGTGMGDADGEGTMEDSKKNGKQAWSTHYAFDSLPEEEESMFYRAMIVNNYTLLNHAIRKIGGIPVMLFPELGVENPGSRPPVQVVISDPDEKVMIVFVAHLFHRISLISPVLTAAQRLSRAWRGVRLRRELKRRQEDRKRRESLLPQQEMHVVSERRQVWSEDVRVQVVLREKTRKARERVWMAEDREEVMERVSLGNVQESFLSFNALTGTANNDITDVTNADISQENLANLSVIEALSREEEKSLSESTFSRENENSRIVNNSGVGNVPWAEHELEMDDDVVLYEDGKNDPQNSESNISEDHLYDMGDGDAEEEMNVANVNGTVDERDGALASILAVEQMRQAHAVREEAVIEELERRLAREREEREEKDRVEREMRERERVEREMRDEEERKERERERQRLIYELYEKSDRERKALEQGLLLKAKDREEQLKNQQLELERQVQVLVKEGERRERELMLLREKERKEEEERREEEKRREAKAREEEMRRIMREYEEILSDQQQQIEEMRLGLKYEREKDRERMEQEKKEREAKERREREEWEKREEERRNREREAWLREREKREEEERARREKERQEREEWERRRREAEEELKRQQIDAQQRQQQELEAVLKKQLATPSSSSPSTASPSSSSSTHTTTSSPRSSHSTHLPPMSTRSISDMEAEVLELEREQQHLLTKDHNHPPGRAPNTRDAMPYTHLWGPEEDAQGDIVEIVGVSSHARGRKGAAGPQPIMTTSPVDREKGLGKEAQSSWGMGRAGVGVDIVVEEALPVYEVPVYHVNNQHAHTNATSTSDAAAAGAPAGAGVGAEAASPRPSAYDLSVLGSLASFAMQLRTSAAIDLLTPTTHTAPVTQTPTQSQAQLRPAVDHAATATAADAEADADAGKGLLDVFSALRGSLSEAEVDAVTALLAHLRLGQTQAQATRVDSVSTPTSSSSLSASTGTSNTAGTHGMTPTTPSTHAPMITTPTAAGNSATPSDADVDTGVGIDKGAERDMGSEEELIALLLAKLRASGHSNAVMTDNTRNSTHTHTNTHVNGRDNSSIGNCDNQGVSTSSTPASTGMSAAEKDNSEFIIASLLSELNSPTADHETLLSLLSQLPPLHPLREQLLSLLLSRLSGLSGLDPEELERRLEQKLEARLMQRLYDGLGEHSAAVEALVKGTRAEWEGVAKGQAHIEEMVEDYRRQLLLTMEDKLRERQHAEEAEEERERVEKEMREKDHKEKEKEKERDRLRKREKEKAREREREEIVRRKDRHGRDTRDSRGKMIDDDEEDVDHTIDTSASFLIPQRYREKPSRNRPVYTQYSHSRGSAHGYGGRYEETDMEMTTDLESDISMVFSPIPAKQHPKSEKTSKKVNHGDRNVEKKRMSTATTTTVDADTNTTFTSIPTLTSTSTSTSTSASASGKTKSSTSTATTATNTTPAPTPARNTASTSTSTTIPTSAITPAFSSISAQTYPYPYSAPLSTVFPLPPLSSLPLPPTHSLPHVTAPAALTPATYQDAVEAALQQYLRVNAGQLEGLAASQVGRQQAQVDAIVAAFMHAQQQQQQHQSHVHSHSQQPPTQPPFQPSVQQSSPLVDIQHLSPELQHLFARLAGSISTSLPTHGSTNTAGITGAGAGAAAATAAGTGMGGGMHGLPHHTHLSSAEMQAEVEARVRAQVMHELRREIEHEMINRIRGEVEKELQTRLHTHTHTQPPMTAPAQTHSPVHLQTQAQPQGQSYGQTQSPAYTQGFTTPPRFGTHSTMNVANPNPAHQSPLMNTTPQSPFTMLPAMSPHAPYSAATTSPSGAGVGVGIGAAVGGELSSPHSPHAPRTPQTPLEAAYAAAVAAATGTSPYHISASLPSSSSASSFPSSLSFSPLHPPSRPADAFFSPVTYLPTTPSPYTATVTSPSHYTASEEALLRSPLASLPSPTVPAASSPPHHYPSSYTHAHTHTPLPYPTPSSLSSPSPFSSPMPTSPPPRSSPALSSPLSVGVSLGTLHSANSSPGSPPPSYISSPSSPSPSPSPSSQPLFARGPVRSPLVSPSAAPLTRARLPSASRYGYGNSPTSTGAGINMGTGAGMSGSSPFQPRLTNYNAASRRPTSSISSSYATNGHAPQPLRGDRRTRPPLRGIHAAAARIQALVRGHLTRQVLSYSHPQLRHIRMRVRSWLPLRPSADKASRFSSQLQAYLRLLLESRKLSDVSTAVTELERLAALLPGIACPELVRVGAIRLLLKLIQTCNRSPAHTALLHGCLMLLRHLSHCSATRAAVYAPARGSSTEVSVVLAEAMQLFRDRPEVVLACCAILRYGCLKAGPYRDAQTGKTQPGFVSTLSNNGSVVRRLQLILALLRRRQQLEGRVRAAQRVPPREPVPTAALLDASFALQRGVEPNDEQEGVEMMAHALDALLRTVEEPRE